MDNKVIYVKNFGSYEFDWSVLNTYEDLFGLTPIYTHISTYEVINEKIFNYAIVKYEIEFELLREFEPKELAFREGKSIITTTINGQHKNPY